MNSSAPVVWLALEELAAKSGSSLVTPTRPQISEITGIKRKQTISAALTALVQGGWIERSHKLVTKVDGNLAKLTRIFLLRPRNPFDTSAPIVRKRNRSKGKQSQVSSGFRSETAHTPSSNVGSVVRTFGVQVESSTEDLNQHHEPLNAEGVPMGIAVLQQELRAKNEGVME